MDKTNVMRLLDVAKINYTSHEYDPETVDGMKVAMAVGEDPECVFKTLICENPQHEYFVFDIPVCNELDLKKAAKACKSKSIELIPQKKLLPLTGYVHGGCSPMGLKKPFPVYIDETAQLFDTIFVSAGKRGCQVGLSPLDLQEYTQATFVDLVEE